MLVFLRFERFPFGLWVFSTGLQVSGGSHFACRGRFIDVAEEKIADVFVTCVRKHWIF